MSKPTLFLGGTYFGTTWRDEIIPKLDKNIEYFNPLVDDWTPACQKIEDEHKAKDDILLFVITPESKSLYSICELTACSITAPNRTVVCLLEEANGHTFQDFETKAWVKIISDIKSFGATCFNNLNDLVLYLNKLAQNKKTKK